MEKEHFESFAAQEELKRNTERGVTLPIKSTEPPNNPVGVLPAPRAPETAAKLPAEITREGREGNLVREASAQETIPMNVGYDELRHESLKRCPTHRDLEE